MSTLLNFGRDVQGFNAYAPPPSTDGWSATIVNGSPTNITIPSNYENWIVSISPQSGANVWVDFSGATAIIPIGAVLSPTTSRLNPGPRTVKSGSNVSIITDNASVDVGIELYAVS